VTHLRKTRPGPLLPALLLALTVTAPQPSAWASHGGTDQLSAARAGPYAVSAWTRPNPAWNGWLSVGVAVMRPGTQVPVLDAVVRLTANSIDQGKEPVAVEATRRQGANRLLYNADMKLPSEGRWQVTVSVAGPEGSGSAAFQIQVKRPSITYWLAVGLGGGTVGLILVWLVWRRRRDALEAILAAFVLWLFASGCAREARPERIALEYSRAVYASDLAQAYRLISSQDRRVKNEEIYLRGAPTGFALEVSRQLASFLKVTHVEQTINGDQARVKLQLKLPDANAPEIATLVREWDERLLNALLQSEREEITRKLDQLARAQKIPMIEGEENFSLVREGSGWRVFLNWAGGARVRFRTAMREAIPLQVTVSPEEVLLTPGERMQVVVRVKNVSSRDFVTRVGHRIEPKAQAGALALLQCPLFVPVTLKPGETEEFRSEYMMLRDSPDQAKEFEVTYEFFPAERTRGQASRL